MLASIKSFSYLATRGLLLGLLLLGLLMFGSGMTQADDTFDTKERFRNPAKIPTHILHYLNKQSNREAIASCQEAKPHELFEAELISLNQSTKAYLVKPARSCLCTAVTCPVWLLQAKGSTAKLLWHMPATSVVEVLDKKLNGYRKIKEAYTDEAHGSESIWSWDRINYTEIYKNSWKMDAEKKCRLGEETIQLVDGKMVNHTIKCPQD
jgi:hypothetical protein